MKYDGLTGKVITPSDPEYPKARQEYNKIINDYPAAIVYCYKNQDVINAVNWAKRNCVPLRIRSGGHNYEGYSDGTGVLVIDTSPMNAVKVNTGKNTATVQAGTRLIDLYTILYKHGYAFPGGTCPTVAISGLVLGGGIGLSMRYLGLACDSLIEAKMVDAKGNLLTADRKHNPDLFWALRGAGGGNFGVVTSYKFKLKKVNKITLIQLRWNENKAARIKFLSVWQNWLKNLDTRISAFGGIYKLGAWINCFFYGEPKEARKLMKPFLRIPGLTLKKIKYVDFIEAVDTIARAYGKRIAFESPGRFVYEKFSKKELRDLVSIVNQAPSDDASTIRVYSMGGAVRDTDARKTAFYYRDADYIMAISSEWKSPNEATINEAWIEMGFKYIKHKTTGSYVNFPYNKLRNYELAYYGGNVERLQKVKSKYDPENVFTFPQGIC
jgi:FAD/FMN-containing dehydrogenase